MSKIHRCVGFNPRRCRNSAEAPYRPRQGRGPVMSAARAATLAVALAVPFFSIASEQTSTSVEASATTATDKTAAGIAFAMPPQGWLISSSRPATAGAGLSGASNSLAVGPNAYATGRSSTAVGWIVGARGDNSLAAGYFAAAGGRESTALGAQAEAYEWGSIGVGYFASSRAEGAVAIGQRASVADANARFAVAIGERSSAWGLQSIALGHYASARGEDAIAIGRNATTIDSAAGVSRIAIGGGAVAGTAGWTGALALGGLAKAEYDGVAIGHEAKAIASSTVALGRGSVADEKNTVSVGSLSSQRRIVNVADGALGMESNDAVTGRQLYATNEMVGSQRQALANHADQLTDHAIRIAGSREEMDQLRTDFDGFVPDLERVVRFDDGGTRVDMGGAQVTGVAAGDISSAASTDAVNGGQLFATNIRVERIEDQNRFIAFGIDDPRYTPEVGIFGVAMGEGAYAAPDLEGATAVGAYATARGKNSVTLGRAAHVWPEGEDGFALGGRSQVYVKGGLALGAEAQVLAGADNGVAVGYMSFAKEKNSVSFGNDLLTRRLVKVSRGTQEDNATTVAQLDDSLATLGGNAGLDVDGKVIAPAFSVQGRIHDTVAAALGALDGAVFRTDVRVSGIEDQLHAVFEVTSSARNGAGLPQVMLAGADGMVLSNLANGMIAPGSRDAVNGGQLHAVQQLLNGRMDGLEQRVDEQPSARPLAMAAGAEATVGTPVADADVQVPQATGSPPQGAADGGSTMTGRTARDDEPPAAPQVDTRPLDEMLARANQYTDGAINGLEKRLDRMDRRYNRMAAMSSAQGAMAMNTAGLQTMNRLGAGVGHAEGEAAMAVGYQRVLNPRGSATLSLHGAFTNSGERGVGLGVGVGW